MPDSRKIIHIDMDAFYASVEQRDRPELRGKPVIVGGPPDSRGVVAACSYEARKFKIRSAMSSSKAARLCPHAIFVPPRFQRYKEVSQKLMAILREATDNVEPLALDEAYLDVTQNKLQEPSATKIAVYLRSRIRGQLSLTASAGVAPNKFLAKLASEMRKPDGLFVIPPHKVEEIVQDLEVEKLWGIGPATAKKLHARGWHSTADLRRLSPENLVAVLGSLGTFIHGLAHGEDPRKVCAERTRKSRGAETTFAKDILDIESLEKHLRELTERISNDLAKKDTAARQICLKIRYGDFSQITRSKTLPAQTSDEELLFTTARDLLRHTTQAGKTPIRLIGISVSGFEATEEASQLSLPIG